MKKLKRLENLAAQNEKDVDQAVFFLKNPNELVIKELNERFLSTETEAQKLSEEMFDRLSQKNSKDFTEAVSAGHLTFFYPSQV